jgi:hypothetical protein
MSAANSQPTAMQKPPKTIHKTFNSRLIADMTFIPAATEDHGSDVALCRRQFKDCACTAW